MLYSTDVISIGLACSYTPLCLCASSPSLHEFVRQCLQSGISFEHLAIRILHWRIVPT